MPLQQPYPNTHINDPNPNPYRTREYHQVFASRRKHATYIADGTEKHRRHIEAAVLQLSNGERVSILPWFQGNKAGATTAAATIRQVDLCQQAYGLFYDAVTDEAEKARLGLALY